ncbi:MAG: flippase [Roseivirga sp.]
MSETLVKSFKTTSSFALLALIRPLTSVLFIPVYLRYLAPAEYGTMGLLLSFTAILTVLANLKLTAALRVQYFQYSEAPAKAAQFTKNVFSFLLLFALGAWLLMLWIGPGLFDLIFARQNIAYRSLGLLAVSAALTNICKEPMIVVLRNERNLKALSRYIVVDRILTISAQLLLIIEFNMGVAGIFYGILLADILLLSFMVLYEQMFTFNIQKEFILPALRFTIPLIPFGIMEAFQIKFDKYFVGLYTTLEDVGLYTLAMTIGGMIYMLLTALMSTIRPMVYKALNQPDASLNATLQRHYTYYIVLAFWGLYGLFIAGTQISLFTDNEVYASVEKLMGLTILVFIPIPMTRIFNSELMYLQRSKEVTGYTFIKLVLTLALYFLLLPRIGLEGALITLLISNFFNMMIFGFTARKHMEVKAHPWRVFFTLTGVLIISILIHYHVNSIPFIIKLIGSSTLILLTGIYYLKKFSGHNHKSSHS